jgi:hypothetical protein
LRPLSRAAFAIIEKQDPIADFAFPAGPEAEGYQGLPRLWRTVQKAARVAAEAAAAERGEPAPKAGPLDGVTLHSLLHSFAGIAEQLGATIPTIAALLGHRVGGVTGGYILKRVDVLLVDAAKRVADHLEKLMCGEAPPSSVVQFVPRGRVRRIRELAVWLWRARSRQPALRKSRREPAHNLNATGSNPAPQPLFSALLYASRRLAQPAGRER